VAEAQAHQSRAARRGAHGPRFTWGVLEQLLSDDRLAIEGYFPALRPARGEMQ